MPSVGVQASEAEIFAGPGHLALLPEDPCASLKCDGVEPCSSILDAHWQKQGHIMHRGGKGNGEDPRVLPSNPGVRPLFSEASQGGNAASPLRLRITTCNHNL
jgi:hypothetical protein